MECCIYIVIGINILLFQLNPGSIGYYRVQYSSELLKRLIPAIRNKELDAIDRIGVVNDLFHMVKFGYSSTTSLLNLLTAFENESEFLVWSMVCRILNKLAILISHTSFEDEFKRVRLNYNTYIISIFSICCILNSCGGNKSRHVLHSLTTYVQNNQ